MKKPKFSGINKRHLTLMGMVVVIAIAGYVNVNYKKSDAIQTMSTITKDENIQKGYINGRYGAIPFIRDIDLWLEDN